LKRTLRRIRYQQGLPPIWDRAKVWMPFRERRYPLSDGDLGISVEHVLHHLNWCWNERHCAHAGSRKMSSPSETNYRPKFCVAKIDLIKSTHRIPPLNASSYVRYVRKWKNKRIRPMNDESLARLVARALLMHPLFSLSRALQAKSPCSFYPDFNTRKGYCREKLDGCRDLRWALGDVLRVSAYWRESSEYGSLQQAFSTKDSQVFCLHLSIAGQRLSMKHIRMMVDCGKFELLEDLFAKVPRAWKFISPRELLLWVCADGRFNDEAAARLVKMIESVAPGIVARTTDVFGDTPLWYTLYRYQYGGHVNSGGWQENAPKLERLLRRLGCDPHGVNRLGLSWASVHGELLKLR